MRILIGVFFLILGFCSHIKAMEENDLTADLNQYLQIFGKKYADIKVHAWSINNKAEMKKFDEEELTLIIRSLIEKGARVNYAYKFPPLHFAAQSGNLDLIKFLIERKANIDAADENAFTPLIHAARNNQPHACKELIRLRASVTEVDRDGRTALVGASGDCIAVLVSNGAYMDARDQAGITPLKHAIYNENIKAIKTLIKLGVDINENFSKPFHSNRQSPLQASANLDPRIEMMLIGHGADFHQSNSPIAIKISLWRQYFAVLSTDSIINMALEDKLGKYILSRLKQLEYTQLFEHPIYLAIRLRHLGILREVLHYFHSNDQLSSAINNTISYDTTPLKFSLIIENLEAMNTLFSFGASAMADPDLISFVEKKWAHDKEKKSAIIKKLHKNCRDFCVLCLFGLTRIFPSDIARQIIYLVVDGNSLILGDKWFEKVNSSENQKEATVKLSF